MALQIVFVAAALSTGLLAQSHAAPREPSELAVDNSRRDRVAQKKGDAAVPGGLPGRSESSEEAGPKTRGAKKSKKPAAKAKDGKTKDAPGKAEKKDPQ
jgi:hypothetical protein